MGAISGPPGADSSGGASLCFVFLTPGVLGSLTGTQTAQYNARIGHAGIAVRPAGSPEELEKRRRRAIALLQQGLSLRAIARRIGCHASSVMRWRDAWLRGGSAALAARPAPGRPPRLTASQKQQLVDMLSQGAAGCGFRAEAWSLQRIARLIERQFGVKYHRNHVGKLLHRLGWPLQKRGPTGGRGREARSGDAAEKGTERARKFSA